MVPFLAGGDLGATEELCFGRVKWEILVGHAGEMLCRQLDIGAFRNQGWSLRFGSSVLLFIPMGLKKSLRENG